MTNGGKALRAGIERSSTRRPQLSELLANNNTKVAWNELWEGLHHQGDVGEASYAAVPHLVRIYRERREFGWNTYAIVAVIELARDDGKNPKMPKWYERKIIPKQFGNSPKLVHAKSCKQKSLKKFGRSSAYLRFPQELELTQSF